MVRAILIFGIAAVLVILTIENAVTVLPLVVLGLPLLSLPLSVWLLGAIAAGAATTLLFAGLVQLNAPRSRRSDAYAPNASYGFRTPPEPRPPTDRTATQRASAAAAQEIWDDPDFQGSSATKSAQQSWSMGDRRTPSSAEDRPPRSEYGTPEPTPRPKVNADDWENRRPLNLESWEDWGLPNRSAPSSNRAPQTPFAPPPYRPPAQNYAASPSYEPPVVDAEVVTPRRPAESDDDADEDYYLDEDDYRDSAPEPDPTAYRDQYQPDDRRAYQFDDDDSAYRHEYSGDYQEDDQENIYQSQYSDAGRESEERGWQAYDNDYRPSDEYDTPYTDAEVYDDEDIETDTAAAPFPFYREPGTEFEWPVQPEDDRPDEAEPGQADVWESWNEAESSRSRSSARDFTPETADSSGSGTSDPDLDVWDDWDDAERDRPASESPETPSNSAPSQPRITITEVQQTPIAQRQSGTIYSYSYRPHDATSMEEPSNEADAETSDRILITPPAPEKPDEGG